MSKKWLIFLLSSCLTFLLIFQPTTHSQTPPISTSEIRGVWLTNVASGVFFVPWGIQRAIHQLASLNFNTIYPVVWNRGHTFYPSEAASQVTGRKQDLFLSLTKPLEDTLEVIVETAHEQGLRVIPWFEYGFMAPANSYLAKQHPHWLTNSLNHQLQVTKNIDEKILELESQKPSILNRISDFISIKKVWLNPLHTEVQQFLENLILELVTNYQIDGIQIDDHWGMPVELGYDDFTIKLYQSEHEGQKPPTNPKNREWMRWRANKITQFMTKLNKQIKALKPSLKISISPNNQEFSYNNYLQDWQTWVQKSLVDEIILQVYRHDLKKFNQELQTHEIKQARQKVPVAIGITTGTWHNPVSSQQIQQQVNLVREQKFAGVCFFYWETLWTYLTPESPQQRRQMFQDIFATPPSQDSNYFWQQLELLINSLIEYINNF